MDSQFIKVIMQEINYQRKVGTATSYYRVSGVPLFPERLSISWGNTIRQTARKGRNLEHKVIGQMLGTFKKSENSVLKINPPFEIRTNIYQNNDFPLLEGYGTIGISNHDGKINRQSDYGDLAVFSTSEVERKNIKIYFFARALMNLPEIMGYLSSIQ
jgi:hypothetical protein